MNSEKIKILPHEDPKISQGAYNLWLMPWIRKRIAHNQDVLGIFVGPRGSGKSYAALELARRCDASFTADRVYFDVIPFVDELVDGKLTPGSATVLDDAGVFMNARDWQSVGNKSISIITQSFRYKNLITFITVPSWSLIDAQARQMVNIFFEATKQQGVFKIKLPKQSYPQKAEWNLVFPVVEVLNESMRYIDVQLKTINFALPPADLVKSYEEKRSIEMSAMQKRVQRELHELNEKKEPKKSTKEQIEYIVMKMHREGLTIRTISSFTDVSKSTVQYIISKNKDLESD